MSLLKASSAPNAPLPILPRCNACRLDKSCAHPKLEVQGSGRLPLMIVSAFPALDQSSWSQSMGRVKQALSEVDVKLSDCTLTGALICNPGTVTVDSERLRHCLPNIIKAIKDYDPIALLLMGQEPVTSVITHFWKTPAEKLERWVGLKIPNQKPNLWVCPTWNPSYLSRAKEDPWLTNSFANHIKDAAILAQGGSRPWDELPNYRDKVERILDPIDAAKIIRKMIEKGGLCAFDYECDRLKPDHPKSRIVTNAICWRGKRTIAYPMTGEAIAATKEFLQSDCPKIACNMKFEERWTMRHFNCQVRNWVWDTLNGAHYLDNRSEITSIKFQSYAVLGEARYNSNVDPTLKSSGSCNSPNRITQGDLWALLLYNGLDALLEYEVGVRQMEQLNVNF